MTFLSTENRIGESGCASLMDGLLANRAIVDLSLRSMVQNLPEKKLAHVHESLITQETRTQKLELQRCVKH